MPLDPELLELFPHKVSVKKRNAGTNLYNQPTFGTAIEYDAQVVYQNRIVRAASGDEVVSRARATLASAPGLTTLDEVTLPDGTKPVILSVERFPDESGDHHEVIHFGGA